MNSLFLLRLAKAFATHRTLTLGTVGAYAAGDGKFFHRLDNGSDCTTRRAEKVAEWFSDAWPADLDWPAEIPRPTTPAARKGAA